jgi:hypothetical protein
MIRKTIRPLLFPNYDILRIFHKRDTRELTFDVIVQPITERCYNYNRIILEISLWSILFFICLSRNKKYLYI